VNHYEAFALTIASALPLPELAACSERKPDVRIGFAMIADEDRHSGLAQVFLSIPGIARFLIRNGTEVIIEADDKASEADIRLFVLGSAMGAILQQRGQLVLHGNAVEIDQQCVTFVGPSGSGKSTLAFAFQSQGFRILADDVCAVSLTDPLHPRVVPSFAQIKLWEDSAQALGESTLTKQRIHNRFNKFAFPSLSHFAPLPLPLSRVYVLNPCDKPGFSVETLMGHHKFIALHGNTYRPQFLCTSRQKEEHLAQCALVAKSVTVKRISRPKEPFLIRELTQFLLQDIQIQPRSVMHEADYQVQ